MSYRAFATQGTRRRRAWNARVSGNLSAVGLLACCAAFTMEGAATAAEATRWTAATPDGMLDAQKARAVQAKAADRDAMAAIATIAALDTRSSYGHAHAALREVGGASSLPRDVREEALVAARAMAADEGSAAGLAADRARGVVTELALLGPFRDTGGGLGTPLGPEGSLSAMANPAATYSWGTVLVGWRKVPQTYATARGVPLDLFVHPRRESCSLVATRVTLPKAQPIVVRLASTGAARLVFDGIEIGKSEEVATKALFDRIAGKVEASAGSHLVWAKVCTGALPDEGRVRLRITDADGAPLSVETSADLRGTLAGGAKPHVTPVATPLGRALAKAKEEADGAEGALDTIVLRTLGGADDLRTPRAPGLLDALTRRPDLGVDRLAMAGWVAPSGANRSGWLNQARDRAAKEGDAATREFVERRLVAEHLGAKLYDWAYAALQGMKPASRDPEAVLIRASVETALGTDALRAKALRDTAEVFRTSRERAPTALVSELSGWAQSFDPQLSLAASEELARRGLSGAHLVAARSQRGRQAVVEAAKSAFEGSLDDADEALRIADEASHAGAHDVSLALYRTLVDWVPNRPETWAGFADELGASSASGRGGAEAANAVTAALRRARELSPGDARYRAELALRKATGDGGDGGEAGEVDARDDEKYIVAPSTILARRQGIVDKGAQDVAARDLHFLRAVVMHPDNRVSQLIHYAREIVIAPRTQNELYEDIPAEGDLTEILRARVHRKAGGTAFPTEEHNEGTRPRIRWPDLLPGDVVEVVVRSWTSRAVGGRGDPPFYFLDYAGAPSTHPLLYNQTVIIAPTSRPLHVDVINGQPQRKIERDESGRHVLELIWDRPVTVPEEPLAPAMSEIVPVVVGSTFKTWDDFRTWYSEAIAGFTVPDDEVRRLAAELTKGKKTRDDKVRALFNFVADDIRYVNYVSGEWWLPNRPHQLLARREGDCDDKAVLLITLLRAVGIEAQEVMVQTRLTGMPSVVLAKNAAVPMFDHGIAFLPGPKGGTYLDATSPQSRLGPVPSMDARAMAFRLDGPSQIVELPKSSPDDHGASVNWTITMHEDGSGDLVGEERHVGDGAFWLRTYVGPPDGRMQYVEDNLVGGWFPTVQVDKKVDFDGELPHGEAKVAYRAHSDGLARKEQNELVVPVSPNQTLASQLAPLVERTQPVVLPPHLAPSHNDRRIRVVAPPGFRWADLPPGGDVNGGEFGRAHLDIVKDPKDPRAVVITRNVVFDLHMIPKEKYAAWRGFLQRMDSLLHKGVRLVRAPETRGAK